MSSAPTAALGLSRTLLRVLIACNAAAAVLLVGAFVASFAFEDGLSRYYRGRLVDAAMLVPTLRVWLVIGLPYLAAVHILLSRLREVVETVRVGTPFLPANAARLRTMAWCLLVLQLLHLVFGIMAAIARAANADVAWSFSVGGWLAVLLLFVPARVFEEGARIDADLEAMI